MKKKFLVAFAVALIAAGSTVQAELIPIKSMSATNVGTSFGGGIGSVLTMNGVGGINCEYITGFVNTYGTAQFSLNTTLTSDNSSGGIASGNFAGGSFSYYADNGGSNVLLSGNIVSFNLVEIANNSGVFVGQGYFNVTDGSLQANFGPSGNMVDITFSVIPNTISNFSSPGFTASSNMTVLPIPEPITIGFLSLGSLVILRKRKHS